MNYKGETGKLYGVRFSHIYESSGFRYTGFCADKTSFQNLDTLV